MSDSLQPHGLWPAKLLCPWDSLGKNTGVGCHALLQGNLPNPGIESKSLMPPAWQGRSLPLVTPGKPNDMSHFKKTTLALLIYAAAVSLDLGFPEPSLPYFNLCSSHH